MQIFYQAAKFLKSKIAPPGADQRFYDQFQFQFEITAAQINQWLSQY